MNKSVEEKAETERELLLLGFIENEYEKEATRSTRRVERVGGGVRRTELVVHTGR